MAAQVHNVLSNFYYWIKSIAPTSGLVQQRFYDIDPESVDVEVQSGFARAFFVEWKDSDADQWATDSDHREAKHNFHVVVHYPLVLPWDKMHELISKDRHDIVKVLRRKSSAIGIAGSTTLDIGLMNRERTGDRLDNNGAVWILTTSWRCKIAETEIEE